MSIIWAELHKKGMRLVMYYSSGNYEAFARPKKPVNVDNKFILYWILIGVFQKFGVAHMM